MYLNYIYLIVTIIYSILIIFVIKNIRNDLDLLSKSFRKSVDKTEYSEKIIKFTKDMINKISILKFSSFIDSHYIDKITKLNIENLASDVAHEIYESIDIDKINFENVLFTKEFYEKYIIETSLATIKTLLEETINSDDK